MSKIIGNTLVMSQEETYNAIVEFLSNNISEPPKLEEIDYNFDDIII